MSRGRLPADLQRAADLFREALELDPAYADAWAGLGSAYKRMPIVSARMPERSASGARRRRSRDRSSIPSTPKHTPCLERWRSGTTGIIRAPKRLLRRALALQPSSADTQVFLAHLFSNLGRNDEALEEIRRARALDPLWLVPRALEGQFLFMARRYDESLRHLEEMLKIAPMFWPARIFHTWALGGAGRLDETIAACDAILESDRGPDGSGLGPLALKGYVLARLGRRAEAEATSVRCAAIEEAPRSCCTHLDGMTRR